MRKKSKTSKKKRSSFGNSGKAKFECLDLTPNPNGVKFTNCKDSEHTMKCITREEFTNLLKYNTKKFDEVYDSGYVDTNQQMLYDVYSVAYPYQYGIFPNEIERITSFIKKEDKEYSKSPVNVEFYDNGPKKLYFLGCSSSDSSDSNGGFIIDGFIVSMITKILCRDILMKNEISYTNENGNENKLKTETFNDKFNAIKRIFKENLQSIFISIVHTITVAFRPELGTEENIPILSDFIEKYIKMFEKIPIIIGEYNGSILNVGFINKNDKKLALTIGKNCKLNMNDSTKPPDCEHYKLESVKYKGDGKYQIGNLEKDDIISLYGSGNTYYSIGRYKL